MLACSTGSAWLALVVSCAAPAPRPETAAPPPRAAEARPAAAPAPGLPAGTGPWVHAAQPDLRRVTVVVKASPPPALAVRYRQLATRYQRLEPVLRGAAEGGFGSGFSLVWRGASGAAPPRAFVVTNRHVVDLATDALVVFGGTELRLPAVVVDVDPLYDLALLAPAGDLLLRGWPEQGLDVASAPPKDQEVVVASGYPGLGSAPSYQVTRGIVSNERFLLDDGTGERLYFQHTAAIDPGSSGGPLTTEDGRLLGVNTLKARNREAVGLAVPASAVVAAVERAASARPLDEAASASQARGACEALVRALSLGKSGLGAAERAIGSRLAADEGMNSLGYLQADGEWAEAFIDDPTRVIVRALGWRLLASALPDGGSATAGCVPVSGDQAPAAHRFTVKTRGGAVTWSFVREQGVFKLDAGPLAAPKGEAPGGSPHNTKKWSPTLR